MATHPALSHEQIATCFNRTLGHRYAVRLIGGAMEPVYLPRASNDDLSAPGSAANAEYATIRYTRDYPASALHELAHWCIAGRYRRQLVDYGYWYSPPPRSSVEQAEFQRVELAVQALEAVLADACGVSFRVSLDDVGCSAEDVGRIAEDVGCSAEDVGRIAEDVGCSAEGGGVNVDFAHAVAERKLALQQTPLPPRAAELLLALRSEHHHER